MPIVVAIDGPAGSGKSSVSKAVAERLGYGYLDTGAGYRAFALHAINNPASSLEDLLKSFDYEISLDPLKPQVLLAGEDVTNEIRTQEVASRVSEFAREQRVRALQHQDARTRIVLCGLQGVVSEGRDLTTVVFADADVRILLTASEEVRLERRSAEKTESTENLKARDASDSKVVEFMAPAEGVKLIDTSHLSFEESVEAVIAEIERSRA
ncbi:(d)CMP kinase [Aquiluna sp.]|nr:(d)CMP kinase [Aquiluna sp.]